MPWTKGRDQLSAKMQNTFDKMSEVILDGQKATQESIMKALNIVKKSEQIKHNRLDARIIELECCFKGELEHYRKTLELRERSAATDAEKGRL